jgi:NAD(P)-dependent dehydrogenase (short-subunit alcohol dehydrogenase family)
MDLKDRKIRVNALSPGPIETPMFDKTGLPRETVDEFRSYLLGKLPMGRFGNPEEVAYAALFLASDDSSFITGIELFVDGGIAQV